MTSKQWFSPSRARYFSLLRQRKVPKRKADPKTCPLTRVSCASPRFGRSPNSQDLPRLAACKSSSNRAARSIPNRLRCSAAPTVLWSDARCPRRVPQSGRDRGARDVRGKPEWGRRSLSGSELRATPAWRGTQGIGASRRGVRVPFSLGTFSWASKRKYLAREGETGANNSTGLLTFHRN
jgi:hypothetical protein